MARQSPAARPTQTPGEAGSQRQCRTYVRTYEKTALRLHSGLPKAHSSLLTQIRTGKIGLAGFLHGCRVPGFESPACACGWQWETAKHVIVDCPRCSRERMQLRQAVASTDFHRLSSDPRAAAALTTWFLRLNLLPQFSWAQEQLPPRLTASQSLSLFYSILVGTRAHRGAIPPSSRPFGTSGTPPRAPPP